MRFLPGVLLLLLTGCTGPTTPDPDGLEAPAADEGQPLEELGARTHEPLVYEGILRGVVDCPLRNNVNDYEFLTPETIELPPEAGGRRYLLETSNTRTPELGISCLLFSDGTYRTTFGGPSGPVPAGVTWVQLATGHNVELEYRLTIR